QNRATLITRTVDLFAGPRNRAGVACTVDRIDTMLAQYIRAQLILAGLSAAVYAGSMALLRFPCPLARGIIGGPLRFPPGLGWVIAGAMMLAEGLAVHANVLVMAAVIVIRRVVQNFAIYPRVMGDRLELEPIVVIFALMAGGEIGGLLGVILSLPVAAVL